MTQFAISHRVRHIMILALILATPPARAADIATGDVTAALGPDFFFDTAAIGGGDNNTSNFNRDITGYWTPGATVTLKGLGWASSSAGTTNTSVTATFTDLGPDDAFGTTDDVVVGTVTDNLVFSGAGEYPWDFDSDIVFTSTGSSLRVRIASVASIRRKTTAQAATGQADVKLTLSGTAVGGNPPPVTNTADSSGNWDTIIWDTGSGTTSGGVGDDDVVLIGRYRTVTYRGIPANETLANLNLGENAANAGQGILKLDSGSLNITGDLTVGRNDSANDSFVFANGGTLHVGGNALFGRGVENCDGSLILAGGTVEIDGSLELGGFEQGGSMLRFHDLGSSPALQVGGALVLGRCSLDLTFDSGYTHVPGTVTTLVTYASRDGQFSNFREGEDFNCGPNRFRIHYDAGGNSITLTALENFPASANRPNIILLFADDQGYADIQINGGSYANKYPTPRIQSLADSGALLTDAYVTGGVCHPSRCGLLTGRYQQRYGTDANLGGPGYNGMAVSQRTVPRRLQSLGYRTYGIGKWHMGDTVDYHPNCRGFDRWYGIWAGGRSYWENSTEIGVFQDDMTPKFADENARKYVTDRIGDSCVDFISEHLASPRAADPFFIYVSFTAVHAPVDIDSPPAGSPSSPTDPRFARLASEFGLTASSYLNSPIRPGGASQATTDKNRYDLAAMTLALDENVGKILDKLDAEGITNNTIVVYTNDNGGAGWSSQYGGNYSYNVPLRGYKGSSMTDGSIRVPAAIRWPGTIPAGQTVTDPVISLDWGATFVNAAGDAPAQARNGLDGIDLMPRLKDGIPLPADRVLTWRASGVTGSGSAIRMGDWKMLIEDPSTFTLYNIRNNPAENSNQAGAQPAILADLKQRFSAWESSTIAPFYGSNTTVLDAGLERQGISGGYRLKRSANSLAWLSSVFRTPQPLNADFHYRFLARSTEAGIAANAKLAYALCDSENRSNFIQAIIDFGQGQIRIVDGKSGASASSPLPPPTTDFQEAALDFNTAIDTLSFRYGGAAVSLVLTGSYGALSHFAVGAAAMEGEITALVPGDGRSLGQSASAKGSAGPGTFDIDLAFPGMPPFDPVTLRSAGLTGFLPDPSILVENLGGGRYRASATTIPGAKTEFFRFQLDQP